MIIRESLISTFSFVYHLKLIGFHLSPFFRPASVSKPFISKIADISSRHLAYVFVLVLYVLGYILVAGTSTIQGLSVGRVFASVGEAGADQVTDIIVADLTPLQWRGFMQAMTSAPNIPLAFVGAKIGAAIVDSNQWRWGYGMFCIILVSAERCSSPFERKLF